MKLGGVCERRKEGRSLPDETKTLKGRFFTPAPPSETMTTNCVEELTMEYKVGKCIYDCTDVEQMLFEQRGLQQVCYGWTCSQHDLLSGSICWHGQDRKVCVCSVR